VKGCAPGRVPAKAPSKAPKRKGSAKLMHEMGETLAQKYAEMKRGGKS
jgi:hypothetical protein